MNYTKVNSLKDISTFDSSFIAFAIPYTEFSYMVNSREIEYFRTRK